MTGVLFQPDAAFEGVNNDSVNGELRIRPSDLGKGRREDMWRNFVSVSCEEKTIGQDRTYLIKILVLFDMVKWFRY